MKPPLCPAGSFLVLFFLLSPSMCQDDISGCCTQVRINSSGAAEEHQRNRLGLFVVSGVYNDRPFYTLTTKQEYLFYLQSRGAGLWMVGPNVGQFNGGLANKGDTYCPEDLSGNKWKYTDGSAWHVEKGMRVTCEEKQEKASCVYSDGTDFIGGDLHEDFGGGGLKTDITSSGECIAECDKRIGCKYWTWVKGVTVNCFLKKKPTGVAKKNSYVSGSTSSACDKSQTKEGDDHREPKFNKNEINAQFKITSLKWNDKLKDASTQEFKDLANTIEDSIESMLKNEKDLSDKVDFTVSVERFKKGSVVCDFKVNYVNKEAWIAIPFVIKPSDVTKAMDKNFKLKKGILFQRFLVAANSLNTSLPVDHCAAKGCSHKCNYDYDVEDYVCTCPRSLELGNDQLNCLTPEEAKEQEDAPRRAEDIPMTNEEKFNPDDDQSYTTDNPTDTEEGSDTTDIPADGWVPDTNPLDAVESPQTDESESTNNTVDDYLDEDINPTDKPVDGDSNNEVDTTEYTPYNEESLTEDPFKETVDSIGDQLNPEDDGKVDEEVTDSPEDSYVVEDPKQNIEPEQDKESNNNIDDLPDTTDPTQEEEYDTSKEPRYDTDNFPDAEDIPSTQTDMTPENKDDPSYAEVTDAPDPNEVQNDIMDDGVADYDNSITSDENEETTEKVPDIEEENVSNPKKDQSETMDDSSIPEETNVSDKPTDALDESSETTVPTDEVKGDIDPNNGLIDGMEDVQDPADTNDNPSDTEDRDESDPDGTVDDIPDTDASGDTTNSTEKVPETQQTDEFYPEKDLTEDLDNIPSIEDPSDPNEDQRDMSSNPIDDIDSDSNDKPTDTMDDLPYDDESSQTDHPDSENDTETLTSVEDTSDPTKESVSDTTISPLNIEDPLQTDDSNLNKEQKDEMDDPSQMDKSDSDKEPADVMDSAQIADADSKTEPEYDTENLPITTDPTIGSSLSNTEDIKPVPNKEEIDSITDSTSFEDTTPTQNDSPSATESPLQTDKYDPQGDIPVTTDSTPDLKDSTEAKEDSVAETMDPNMEDSIDDDYSKLTEKPMDTFTDPIDNNNIPQTEENESEMTTETPDNDKKPSEDSPLTDEDRKEPAVHEFDCKEMISAQACNDQGQVPLQCVERGRGEPRTLYFVINEADITADISRLYDENVKVVVKDLMVMDISPK